MTVYAFDVTCSTHDLLKRGIPEAPLGDAFPRMYRGDSGGSELTHHRILIEADSRDEAALVAAQMVHTTTGAMVTGLFDRI